VITALRVTDGRREQALRLATGDALAKVTAEGVANVMRGARLRAMRVADGDELWQSAPLQGFPDAEPETIAMSMRLAAGEQILFYGYQVLIPPVQYTVIGALDASSGRVCGLARDGASQFPDWRTACMRRKQCLRHHRSGNLQNWS
jgi:hypothetical protein